MTLQILVGGLVGFGIGFLCGGWLARLIWPVRKPNGPEGGASATRGWPIRRY